MVLLVGGLTTITTNLAIDMINGKGGTSSTLFDKTQTGLQTGVAGSEVTLSDKTSTTTVISVTHLLDVSTGNGSTYTEFEVNNGTDSYNRAVKAGRAKDSTIELNVVTTFEFEIVV